jgi:hypothetical protein
MTMKGLVGFGIRGRLLLFTAIVALAVLMVSAQSSRAAGPKALILGSTVTPGNAPDGDSFEQEFAEQLGYTVTVATDSQWDSMTAAQFASYQLLILGDPTCGGDPSAPDYLAAQNNMAVWEPVVMASGGNKVLIGTDPVFHSGHPGAQKLIKQGLQFAGAVTDATGVYLDLSCSYDSTPANTPVPILDGLSTHGAHQFTVIGEGAINACATGVNIVAATGPTAGLTDADLSNWSCSVHEAFDHFPSDYTPLALAPSTSGFPTDYCANDVETHKLACGSPYIMVSGSGVTVSSDISLSASPSTQDVGGQVTLNATVKNGSGSPVAGAKVTFNFDSGPNTGVTGSAVTDSSGHASFTYTGSHGAGTDSDSATFTNSAGAQEKATTTVNWTPAITATAGSNMTGTEGTSISGTVATFSDADSGASASEYSATINWGDGKTSTGTISGTPSQFKVTGSHTYAEEGSFTITVTITDVDNSANTATVSEKATISDAALHATGVTPTLSGSTASGNVATFTDANPGGTVSDFTATINWGDGKTTTGTVSKTSSGFAVSGSHDYGKSGTFTITTTIKDKGGASAKATVTISAQVKAAKVKRGSAHVAAVPTACVRSSFTMQVRGTQIASVRVTLDGRAEQTRAVHRGKLYTARMAVSAGRHTVTVHVKFKPASKTKARTFHRSVAGCAAPAFTG